MYCNSALVYLLELLTLQSLLLVHLGHAVVWL